MAFSQELVFVDTLLLLAVIIAIYLTYNASARLVMRKASRWWIVAFRASTIAEIIMLVFVVVDIPWTVAQLFFPQLENLFVLEYLLIYAIVTTMVVFPAINVLLRVSLTKREAERQQLMTDREDLLKQMQLVTAKYLRKELGEAVFIKLNTDLQARIITLESRLERIRIEAEHPGPLFKP